MAAAEKFVVDAGVQKYQLFAGRDGRGADQWYLVIAPEDIGPALDYFRKMFPALTPERDFTEIRDKELRDVVERYDKLVLAVVAPFPLCDARGEAVGYAIADLLKIRQVSEELHKGTPSVIDIGGEGDNKDVTLNINIVNVRTGETHRGEKVAGKKRGEPIPNLFIRIEEDGPLPFGHETVDKVYVESTPLGDNTAVGIANVIKRGGTVVLFHPELYAGRTHAKVIDQIKAGGKECDITKRTGVVGGAVSHVETIIKVK
jgi:hypothetical protein